MLKATLSYTCKVNYKALAEFEAEDHFARRSWQSESESDQKFNTSLKKSLRKSLDRICRNLSLMWKKYAEQYVASVWLSCGVTSAPVVGIARAQSVAQKCEELARVRFQRWCLHLLWKQCIWHHLTTDSWKQSESSLKAVWKQHT